MLTFSTCFAPVRRAAVMCTCGLLVASGGLGAAEASTAGRAGRVDRPTEEASRPWVELWRKPIGTNYPLMRSTDAAAIARQGNELLILWAIQTTASTRGYVAATLGPDGSVLSTAEQIVDGWASASANPRLVSPGADLRIAFVGTQESKADGTGENADGESAQRHVLAAVRGRTVDGQVLSLDGGPRGLDDSAWDVVDGPQGLLWAHPADRGAGLAWHEVSRAGDRSIADGAFDLLGCCTGDIALARDARDDSVYAAFFSTSADEVERGLHVGVLTPNSTEFTRPPLPPWARPFGALMFVPPGQRVAMASDPQGGLVTAFAVGYPQASEIDVWRLGARTITAVPGSRAARRIVLTYGPDGVAWLCWTTAAKVHVARIRGDSVIPGSLRTVAAPVGATDLFGLSASAAHADSVDLVLTATSAERSVGVFTRRVTIADS